MPHIDWNSLIAGGAALWVIGFLVDCLPEPKPEERWYGAFFKAAHGLAANISKFRAPK